MEEQNKLLHSLHVSFEYYKQIETSFRNLSTAQASLHNYKSNRKSRAIPSWFITCVVLASSFVFFFCPSRYFLFLNVLFKKPDTVQYYWPLPIVPFLILFTVLSLVFAHKYKKAKYNKNVALYNAYISQLSDFILSYYDNFSNSGYQVVPYIYCSPDIIQSFIFYIETCRADTMKDAVNCYINDANIAVSQQYQQSALWAAQQTAIHAKNAAEYAEKTYWHTW